MGTWGAGNFDNDGAADYVGELTDGWVATLVANIEECFADKDRSAVDEDGEAVIMPSVAVMSVLCEHCQAQPPKPEVVARWEQEYLAIYDDQIAGLDPNRGYADERRQLIVETFTTLKAQSTTYWREYEEALRSITITGRDNGLPPTEEKAGV